MESSWAKRRFDSISSLSISTRARVRAIPPDPSCAGASLLIDCGNGRSLAIRSYHSRISISCPGFPLSMHTGQPVFVVI
ncbi:hypothetical protein MPTK1_4g02450 [Marchantia polymorpha subsp. ruderalis]|uniref:Uncharacterized protein n=2 Tax=Marchantia polymorpha TaxID=3197 RepID=A0AAF6B5I2_MARPO|nr:hypothetical protein MARPO_0080s0054 [Marchantia polymorpha]BBN07266.1 hypothetical protein Mp_4g02450 [Marchantia polymorpha subsp. ruderalis]|eukprot:PTQ34438.1 hypothetical protein MARPO_0080s0054 [Marchantia polymorpha]